MNVKVAGTLSRITTCAMLFTATASAQSQKLDVTDLQRIPGASALGWG